MYSWENISQSVVWVDPERCTACRNYLSLKYGFNGRPVSEMAHTTALRTLRAVMSAAKDRLILSMGWPGELPSAGITEALLYDMAQGEKMSVRVLGRDTDPGNYGRELYCLQRMSDD